MKHSLLSWAFVALVGGICGFLLWNANTDKEIREENSSIRQSGYEFINPLLECENNDSFAKQKYIPFEQDTIKRIENEVQKTHSGTEIAVYFRNLNNGPWFGINEDARFLPASLMKVTLLISYLKWWEDDSTLMEKRLILSSEVWLNQMIPPDKILEIGKEYTVRELLEYMIIYSDNTASRALFENIPIERQNRVFLDLGIPLPSTDPNYTLSVKEYASFFRVLYNASYLSKKASEAGLAMLAKSTFYKGLTAQIPRNISVAHKFWERERREENGAVTNQLHDCGVIYYENYPYLLCVMTRAKNKEITELSEIVAQISGITFEEIGKRYPIFPKK